MSRPNNNTGKECAQLPRTMPFEYSLKLTLEEMFKGTKRHLLIPRNIVCGRCRGSGSKIPTNQSYDTCELCHGQGMRIKLQRPSADSGDIRPQKCELCWGDGVAIVPEYRCVKCKGQKTVPSEVRVVCEVRRGTHAGDYIILKGKGQQVPNKRPGNIIVKMEAIEHKTFKRDGDDLIATVPLDLVESLAGFDKFLTTVDKKRLHIYSPRGHVITESETQTFKGHGMPKYENPLERGDLIIKFEVNLPNKIRAELAPKLEQCLPRREKVEIPFDAQERNLISMTTGEFINRLAGRDVVNKEEKSKMNVHPTDEYDYWWNGKDKYEQSEHEYGKNGKSIYEPMEDDYEPDYENQIYVRYDDLKREQAYHEGASGFDGQNYFHRRQTYDEFQFYQYNGERFDDGENNFH